MNSIEQIILRYNNENTTNLTKYVHKIIVLYYCWSDSKAGRALRNMQHHQHEFDPHHPHQLTKVNPELSALQFVTPKVKTIKSGTCQKIIKKIKEKHNLTKIQNLSVKVLST